MLQVAVDFRPIADDEKPRKRPFRRLRVETGEAFLVPCWLSVSCFPHTMRVMPPSTKPPRRRNFQIGQTIRGSHLGETFHIKRVYRGGFGIVYVALRPEFGHYAIKTFQSQFLWRDEDHQRFMREVLTWVRLGRHPNIVKALYMDDFEGFPGLVMQLFADRRFGAKVAARRGVVAAGNHSPGVAGL